MFLNKWLIFKHLYEYIVYYINILVCSDRFPKSANSSNSWFGLFKGWVTVAGAQGSGGAIATVEVVCDNHGSTAEKLNVIN